MTAGLSDIRPPSIHAVSTDQVTPAGLVGMIVIVFFDLGYQGRYILCVIENRHPNASLVSRDAFETLSISKSLMRIPPIAEKCSESRVHQTLCV